MNGVIKVIEKTAYVLSVLIGIIIANSCTMCSSSPQEETQRAYTSPLKAENSTPTNYGNYLAGWVAHIRHDLNHAADYYIKAAQYVPDDKMLYNQLYIILTSQGRIEEAAQYAQIAQKKGDSSPFILIIRATDFIQKGNFEQAIKLVKDTDNLFLKDVTSPLIIAWSYAGLNEGEKALEALKPLAQNESFKPIYLLNAVAINDYLGNTKAADAFYTALLNIKHMDLSIFPIQVLSNFYLRENNDEKFKQTLSKTSHIKNLMTVTAIKNIEAKKDTVQPFLTDIQIGLSDALLSLALVIQQDSSNKDLAMLFASLASHLNKDYSLPYMLSADILEKREFYADANQFYNKVKKDDYAYYTAQFQIGKNLIRLGKNDEAEKIFNYLYNNYEHNPDILTNIGEIARLKHKYLKAVEYYQKAIEGYPDSAISDLWPLHFAIGASYSAAGDNISAEKSFRKVLEMKPNRLTQNHLGYILIEQNKNIEEAFELIVSAYSPATGNGSVTDSVGWALYKIGKYDLAVKYLEEASNLAPAEAIIYDHLGDAYWQIGRKREAVYQWNHALKNKENIEDFDREMAKHKITNGLETQVVPDYDNQKIEELIERLKKKRN